jgi:hypothetical protein
MNLFRRVRIDFGLLGLLFVFAVGTSTARLTAQSVTANAAQQMVFAGLRASGAKGQINGLATDAGGDVYLAFDQGDGVRVFKVANDGGALLAQVQLGAEGDTAAAIALDSSGNVYIAGTSTSGSLAATSGAAVGSATPGTTNSFVAKFDANLDELFLTFTGGSRIAASGIGASGDRVFVSGRTYGSDLPVSATAVGQAPASGSVQNGFVEAFSADGTTLEYATYLTGAQGDTTPTGIAVDAGDDAWVVGSTTASGFPTIAAVVPAMLSNPSGFLLQLTPAGDGIVYSTFVPGAGLSSVALDSTGLNLLISGQVALGQFPVDTVYTPLVPTPYQVLLRMSLDGSTVESGTVIAPGSQSMVTATSGGGAWIGGSFPPGAAPLLPQPALSTIGNAYAVRFTRGIGVDQTIRFGGLANFDQTFASVPVGLNGLAVDGSGALFAGGVTLPTASASLLSTETYDLPLRGGPTPALPSVLLDAEVASASCGGSLCSGSGGYLTKIDTSVSGPALVFSADGVPSVTLRNLGSAAANGLQLSTSAGTFTTSCGSSLPPGGDCNLLLAGGAAGVLTAASANGGGTSVAFGAFTAGQGGASLAFVPKELDFGIQTSASAAAVKTITVTNLGGSAATFSEGIVAMPKTTTPFSEVSSDCALAAGSTQKVLAAGASCSISVGFSASSAPSSDGFVQGEWTIGPGEVSLTGYSQAASLSVSTGEIDFGTQFQGGLQLPRYLYLSNASASVQSHSTVSLPSNSPFTVTDECPASLPPGTVCRMRIGYSSSIAPSTDASTLSLDQGVPVLLTGRTMPPLSAGGSTVSSSLAASPTSVTFGNAVVVTGVSSATQTVSVTNSGTIVTPLSLSVSGDFSKVTSCGSSLAAGASCAVAITFTPSQPGVRQGLLTFSAGAGTQPITVALSGTGTAILSTSTNNGTLNSGETPVGQPVVQSYKVTEPFNALSLKTTGPYLVTLVEDSGFGFGDPPASTYVSSGSGTCHNCWLGVRFQPTSAGEQDGTLSFSSASNGLPFVLQLSGAGTATSGLDVSPSVTAFGTIPVHSLSGATAVTLTNLSASGAAINVANVAATGDFMIAANGNAPCGGNLPYAASCSIWLQFAPTTSGAESGALSITTSAGAASSSLTGTGTADPGVSISPLALTFRNMAGQVGELQSVSVENTGQQSISVGTPTAATPNFSLTSNCGTLLPGGSCVIQVGFTPGAAPVADVLTIPVRNQSSNGVAQTQTFRVGLTGNFSAQSQGLAISPGTLAFGPVATSTLSSARQMTLTNLTGRQVAISMAMPRSYELQGQACTALAPSASCVVTIVFLPLENGDVPGTISVTASPVDGSPPSASLLYADGFGVGTGLLTVRGGLIVNGVFNFGAVAAGQSSSQQFTLTNGGTQTITVRRVVTQPPFTSMTSCGSALMPASSCTVTVTYAPAGAGTGGSGSSLPGTDMGTLIMESDAQSSPDVIDLEGQAAAGGGTAGTPARISSSLSESALSFGGTTVGDLSSPQNLMLTNTGTSLLTVSSASATSDFTVQNGCGTVASGDSCMIVVRSTPQATGTRIASLEIASNGADSLEYVTLLGSGLSPPLTFSPGSIGFGDLLVGKSATLPVQITNSGSSAVTFTSVTASGEFAVTGNCPATGGSLPPQVTCAEQVTFNPHSAGASSGAISFDTSASSLPLQVPLSGVGVLPELSATPASVSFGNVALGTFASVEVEFSNLGTTPITGLAATATGDYAVTSPCAQSTLAAGASCALQVTFTPAATGARAGSLGIVSSDPGSPLVVPLTGTGVLSGSFALTVDGSATATATVTSGNYATFSLLVAPTGTFTGMVTLICTPMQTVEYASCSLLPGQLSLASGSRGLTVTINTEQSSSGSGALKILPPSGSSRIFLALLLQGILLIIRRRRSLRQWNWHGLGLAGMLCSLLLFGCAGHNAGPLENDTPPGQYVFQVTASSTSGVPIAQTVTLNLVVNSP